jgi:hypothetical protein
MGSSWCRMMSTPCRVQLIRRCLQPRRYWVLLMVKQSDPVGVIIACLILTWSASEAEEWENHVCFLLLH